MTSLRVLYDGWALSYYPGGEAALHLQALLHALPHEVEPVVALPGPATLPDRAAALTRATRDTPWQRLVWEQRVLPALARQAGAALLHVFSGGPLAGGLPVVSSPAESTAWSAGGGLARRLRSALAAGTSSSVSALLWPADLPTPPGKTRSYALPPLAHPVFSRPALSQPGTPEQYLLFPLPGDQAAIAELMSGWAWCAPTVGESMPLLLAGSQNRRVDLPGDLEPSLLTANAAQADDWARLYQSARAVICLGSPAPWGDPLLGALAAGKAIVAMETPETAARVGPAAYLVPPGDSRALGAALATLAVEEEMAAGLGSAARERAHGWHSRLFGSRLLETYREVL